MKLGSSNQFFEVCVTHDHGAFPDKGKKVWNYSENKPYLTLIYVDLFTIIPYQYLPQKETGFFTSWFSDLTLAWL